MSNEAVIVAGGGAALHLPGEKKGELNAGARSAAKTVSFDYISVGNRYF